MKEEEKEELRSTAGEADKANSEQTSDLEAKTVNNYV